MHSREKFAKIFFVVIIFISLIFANMSPFRDQARSNLLDITERFFGITHFLFYHITGGFSKIGESVDIYKERDRLRVEVANLKSELIQYEEASIENERLRALLDFQQTNGLEGVSAMIIGRDLSAIADMIVVNRGEGDGVQPGTVLISHDGLVGHVLITGKKHAKALLINDVKARVCAISQESRDAGIIEGTATHLLKMKHLDINAKINIGNTIITSGFGGIFPKGIPIGVVEMIGTESDNLHLYALVNPYVNFSKLEEVLCLKDA